MTLDSPSEATGLEPSHSPRHRLELLASEVPLHQLEAELYLLGGAVIAQAFNPKPSTAHASDLFRPTRLVREAAAQVAEREGWPADWMTDAVKDYLAGGASPGRFLDLPGLRVFVAPAEYVLAVKCAALRLGGGFLELADLRFVLRALNIEKTEDALAIITRYFPERQLDPATTSVLDGILSE